MIKNRFKILSMTLAIVSILLIFLMFCCNTVSIFYRFRVFHFVTYCIIVILAILLIVSAVKKIDKLFRLCIVSTITFFTCYLLYFIMERTGTINKISSLESLKQIILSTGNFGRLVFLVINILQVIFLPIPGVVSISVGTALYGPWQTLLLSTTGIVVGSLIAFAIGRRFGYPLACWIFSKEKIDNYQKILGNKTALLLFLMFVLPFFPDDMLCMLAGITNITFKKFLGVTLVARALAVFSVAIFASGYIIPFKGWGIIVWISLAIALFGTLIFALAKHKKLKAKILSILNK